MGPQVEAAVEKNNQMALRKVDIVRWKTPITKQFKIRGIPHFVVYGPDGKLIKEGYEVFQEILNWNPQLWK